MLTPAPAPALARNWKIDSGSCSNLKCKLHCGTPLRDHLWVTAWIPKFPNCIVTQTLYLAYVITLKPLLVVKCSVLPPNVTLLWYMTTLVIKHITINSIVFDNNKHPFRNYLDLLKILIDSCTDLNVDSGSCSGSKKIDSGVKRNFWLVIVFQLFYFSE